MSKSIAYRPLFERFGRSYRLDPRLLEAICRQESAGNPKAFRYEAALRDASFGLMQVLGKTARNIGALPDGERDACLCEPELGIRAGVMVLAENLNSFSSAAQMGRSHGDFERLHDVWPVAVQAAICRYNGGFKGNPSADGRFRNQEYLDGVLVHFRDVCKEVP